MRRADNLTTSLCRMSRNSGNLKLQRSWPVQACNEIVLPLIRPSGYFMYRQVQHSKLNILLTNVFVSFVWVSEQRVIISLYSSNCLVL
jgi:hypothetical protein